MAQPPMAGNRHFGTRRSGAGARSRRLDASAACWPAVAFLLFMLPLPASAFSKIALPLQQLATQGSVYVMQLTGLWPIAEGNVIDLRDHANAVKTLEVAQACNGLSMLMTLAATVVASIILLPLANWKRVMVLATAVPIALLSNVIRIAVTGWFYYFIDDKNLLHEFHDWTGILIMMPLALILVGLELKTLSWLSEESELPDLPSNKPILPGLTQKPKDKMKPPALSDEL